MDKKKLEILRDYFKTQKEILCVYLFGSEAVNKENKFSDVDLGVFLDDSIRQIFFTQKKISLIDEISRRLDKDVDIVVLNNSSSFLKFQVIKTGVRIYERADRSEHNFEAWAIIEYLDYLPIRKRLEKALIDKMKEE
ncbi:MAG: nucleotidyltransferase domain-containing protein [Candidatus Omnitrophota bacterium]|nr:nucleotidyltransferase domain-containing protein [Candidatus Omnitrophota bacterium]